MASDDPEFETTAADIIGVYLHPRRHRLARGDAAEVLVFGLV